MPNHENRTPWYAAGLHFECQQCGACCSGPSQGYIWVTQPEIKLIADFLKIEPEQLRQKYLRRVGFRTTIIEQLVNRDCIFLQRINSQPAATQTYRGEKRCIIYPVRPSQCRAWPFWPENLANADNWNRAAQKCSGINRGWFFSFEEIEKVRRR